MSSEGLSSDGRSADSDLSADAAFLGLVPTGEDGRFRFSVLNRLARLDGRLYGGTAVAVSVCAAELVTDRTARWMTTQFVSTAPAEAHIDVQVEVLAPGRRTNQVRVTGTDESGAVMFASLGATGIPRPDGLAGTFERRPEVSAPVHSEARDGPMEVLRHTHGLEGLPPVPPGIGFGEVVEFREPEILSHPDPGPGRLCLWARRRDDAAFTPALVAFVADMVPLSISQATGVLAGGLSLDNTVRFGQFEPTGWVLLDLRAHAASGSYAYGSVHLWSETGALLASAEQTASMFSVDPANLPWDDKG